MVAETIKGIGRGKLSSIDLLPEDIRVRINEELRERRLTQKQIRESVNALLADRGEKSVSRSALNRYAKQLEEKGAFMREAREAADRLVGGLEAQRSTDLGRAVTELIKAATFNEMMRAQTGGEEPINLDFLNKIALISQRIERASKISVEREKAIREEAQIQERERLKAKAMAAVEQAGVETNGAPMTVDGFKEIILKAYGA